MRIGIYGGTFNPPHTGHVLTAKRAVELCSLDKLIIMPAGIPPHKNKGLLATDSDRYQMCLTAFSDPEYEVSDLEITREGKSYTVETLRQLKEQYPSDELILIIGSDMLFSFDKWYRYEEILTLCRLCVFTRETEDTPQKLTEYAENVLKIPKDDIFIAESEAFVMSSTAVREKIGNSESISGLVPDRTAEYIENMKVYVPDCDRLDEFRTEIKRMLNEKRYIHSLGVADSAAYLAKIYGEDENRAYCAGLLHDVTKYIEPENHEKLFSLTDRPFTPEERSNPSVWHAMSGSAYLKVKLNVKDKEIISAVRYHTTGKKGMTLLEKIVYIADFISADRDYPDVEVMRALAPQSLEKAALYALRYCIGNLIKTGKIIHTDSVDFYNELIMAEKEENNGST